GGPARDHRPRLALADTIAAAVAVSRHDGSPIARHRPQRFAGLDPDDPGSHQQRRDISHRDQLCFCELVLDTSPAHGDRRFDLARSGDLPDLFVYSAGDPRTECFWAATADGLGVPAG